MISNTPSRHGKEPVRGDRRWVVVIRRPGAAAHIIGPFDVWKAREHAEQVDWPDAAVAIYKLLLDEVVA